MAVLSFVYHMEMHYEEMVRRCCFTMKCIPREDKRQRLREIEIALLPDTEFSWGEDSFGNRQIYGCVQKPHRQFILDVRGRAEVFAGEAEEEKQEETTGIFLFPHGKCVPGAGLWQYFSSLDFSGCKDDLSVCRMIMHRLYRDFTYAPGITRADTGAEEAWNLRKGVCQDYAHIYITLLRMAGIPARYVCGLIRGEGQSHGWAEALCGEFWMGFDPTNNCLVGERYDQYIKLGDGRDAADCAINRGIMWGGGAQVQKVEASVSAAEPGE